MKRLAVTLMTFLVAAGYAADTDVLSRERQISIIENYMYATGQLPPKRAQEFAQALGYPGDPPVKCGMSAVADFVLNRDKLDPELLDALGVTVEDRPVIPGEQVYDTPSGLFKIHYTTVGGDAVYRPKQDRDGDGVPDYVEDAALILDAVYAHVIDTLGYPVPPSDSFYPSGGDGKYDVYVRNLQPGFYGATYPDSISIDGPGTPRATSFMELENDFQELPQYVGRPLDAVRVTAAHEFFHAVQFGIDVFEAEPVVGELARRYWMEMSSVWMEEEIYDDINDYYNYLPYFFENPRISIQRFKDITDLHPYGSAIWAIFLSEKYGRDIIRDIWLRCGQLGPGPHFLIAADSAVRQATGGSGDWATTFQEFAIWNYFTGKRGCHVPDGIGYPERLAYPAIYDTAIVKHTQYPIVQLGNQNPRNPQHNSASYIRFNHTRAIMNESFWRCDSGSFRTVCYDSTQVFDTTAGYDTVYIDTLFDLYIIVSNSMGAPLLPQGWGLSMIYQMDAAPDSFAVEENVLILPYNSQFLIRVLNPNQYRSLTAVVSPATYAWNAYESPSYPFWTGYVVYELIDSALIDTPIIIDSGFVDIPAAILAPFPNPAVVSQMNGSPLRFRFQIPTDSFSNYIHLTPHFTVDIFNVAGEFVRAFGASVTPHICEKDVEFTVAWDMNNERGEGVAGGVYVAVGRLYVTTRMDGLLAEDRVKVAIIR